MEIRGIVYDENTLKRCVFHKYYDYLTKYQMKYFGKILDYDDELELYSLM